MLVFFYWCRVTRMTSHFLIQSPAFDTPIFDTANYFIPVYYIVSSWRRAKYDTLHEDRFLFFFSRLLYNNGPSSGTKMFIVPFMPVGLALSGGGIHLQASEAGSDCFVITCRRVVGFVHAFNLPSLDPWQSDQGVRVLYRCLSYRGAK